MTGAGQSGQEPPRPGAIDGKRVLLAEDDPSARSIIAKVLRAMGLEVIETGDGGRLLVAITSYYKDGRSPDDLDLVITDVRMPVLSGLEIFKGLRVAHWTLPVIVMTAYESQEVSDAVKRYGASLLIKPLDLDQLEELVRRVLMRPRPPSSSRPRLEE
jgi:DNA-binding NtrC family response regulator